jgi:putative oxidoreductase
MKKTILALWAVLALFACVQPAYEKTVVITLKVNGIKDIKTVGVRGEGGPLSWNKDIYLQPVVKGSLYTLTATARTGYTFTEIKFTVNGEFELDGKPNRRLEFAKGDTTYYGATFNVLP